MNSTSRNTRAVRGFFIPLCLLLVFGASQVHAGLGVEFVVTNSNNAGPGSLREAIALANATSDDTVTITFDETVSLINITTGPLEIVSDIFVQIEGHSGTGVALDANSNSRILVVTNPDAILALSDLQLLNGRTTAVGAQPATCAPGTGEGGALCSLGAVNLRDVVFSGNETQGNGAHGGAAYTARTNIGGVRSTSFSDNETSGQAAHGGALYAEGRLVITVVPDATVTFANNSASGPTSMGGAIAGKQHSTGVAGQLSFVQNSADFGGAIAISGCSTSGSDISGAAFEGNVANNSGGAVFIGTDCDAALGSNSFVGNSCQSGGGGAVASATDREVFIRQNIFDGNSCKGPGGAIMGMNIAVDDANILTDNTTTGSGHHGGAIAAADLLLANSTVIFNTTQGAEAHGGAIWASGELDIRNSTIARNETVGTQSNGGALYYSGDRQGLVISNVTLRKNDANGTADGIFMAPRLATFAAELTISSSVIADNGASGDNFLLLDTGLGHTVNVIQSVFGDSSTEINGSDVLNIFNDSPAFDTLDDNGCFSPAGPPGQLECPQSYMPDTGSVVLDAGDNPNGEISDQRGFTFPRTFNSATDIGAIEVSPEPSASFLPFRFSFGTYIVDSANMDESDSVSLDSNGPGILHIIDISENSTLTTVQDDCGLQLPPGERCTVTVSLDRTRFFTSSQPPEVTILLDTQDSPLTIPIEANPITGAELEADRASIEFEDTPPGVPSAVETLTLTNAGSTSLEISFVSAGSRFDLVDDGCSPTVAPQASCSLDLQFFPSQPGIVEGQLRIRSNSIKPSSDTYIPMRGTSGIVFFDSFEAP